MKLSSLITILLLCIGCASIGSRSLDSGDTITIIALNGQQYEVLWVRSEVLSIDGRARTVFRKNVYMNRTALGSMSEVELEIGETYLLMGETLIKMKVIGKISIPLDLNRTKDAQAQPIAE